MAPIASRAAACCAFVLALSFSSLAQTTAPAQPSASPPVTDKPQPGERTSHFKPPVIINRVEAKYPEEARRAGLTATVLLQLVVGVNGTVTDAKVAKGAGHGFDEAALEAARQLVFQPAMQDTTPVPVQINTTAIRTVLRAQGRTAPELWPILASRSMRLHSFRRSPPPLPSTPYRSPSARSFTARFVTSSPNGRRGHRPTAELHQQILRPDLFVQFGDSS